MSWTLALTALLLGLAGAPHCVAMCGAACLAVSGGRAIDWPLHVGRVAGYALAGAVVAGTVGALASLGQTVAPLRPLWTLLNAAALGLGLWLLTTGTQPRWMSEVLRPATPAQPVARGWVSMRGPVRSGMSGLAWVAMPCGLLHSALVIAALGNSAWSGALTMASFAAGTSVGLVLGPLAWLRIGGQGAGVPWRQPGVAVRVAGLMLAGACAWSLGHGLWRPMIEACFG